MNFFDTVKSASKKAAPIGFQILADEINKGKTAKPETRPDTKSQPIASTQKFEPTKKMVIPKPALIGGGIGAILLVGFLITRKK